MRIAFSETRAARLRLIVTDARNPPLQVEEVQFSADVRQLVFSPPPGSNSFQIYYGNREAEDPNYDFARNLPRKLQPEPDRVVVGARTPNPVYEPDPLPFTERWPWVVYGVLSLACLLLAALAVSLSRAAITAHDSGVQTPA